MSTFVQAVRCFSLASLVFATALLCPAADPQAGRWEGVAHIPGMEMQIIVDLGMDSSGAWTGSATIPGFDIKGAPLTEISMASDKMAFTIARVFGGVKIAGRLGPEGSFSGEFEQGGNKAECTLRKIGPGQPELPRASTAVSKDLEGEWQGDLTVPGKHFLVRLLLANHAGGPATAQFSVRAKEETDLPVDLIVLEGKWLTITCPKFNLRYEAEFHPDHDELAGAVSQGGFEAPMSLRRVIQTHP